MFGPPNIKELKANGNINGLISALSYKESSQIRFDACLALNDIGDASAVDPLIITLREDDEERVRRRAAGTLGTIGDTRAVEQLIITLKEDKNLSRAAAFALGNIGDPRAVDPLISALKDSSLDMKCIMTVIESLGNIGDDRAVDPLIDAVDLYGELPHWGEYINKNIPYALKKIGTTHALAAKKKLEDNINAEKATASAAARAESKKQLDDLYAGMPSINEAKEEYLINKLVEFGKADKYLSSEGGGKYNDEKELILAKEIGKILNEVGGIALMRKAHKIVKEKLYYGAAREIEYVWHGIGRWQR